MTMNYFICHVTKLMILLDGTEHLADQSKIKCRNIPGE